jgi:predicted RND superfamily exporter protein
MNSLVKYIQKLDGVIIWLSLIISVFMISTLPDLVIRNPHGRMDLPAKDIVLKEYRKFQKMFASRDLIMIALTFEEPLDLPQLYMIERVSDQISQWDRVKSLSSIATAERPDRNFESLETIPLYQRSRQDSVSVIRLRNFLAIEPMFSENIISADGKSAAIILQFEEPSTGKYESVEAYAELISRIDDILSAEKSLISKYHLIGYPLLRVTFQNALKKNVVVFGGLSFILTFISLLIIFRHWKSVTLSFVLALNALLWNLGILSLTNTALSIGLAMMIPLIPVLSIAYSIHYLEFYLHKRNSADSTPEHFRKMISKIFPPSLLTGVTTTLGFFSLLVSDLEGVKELGLFLGIGVLICIFQTCILLPACLWRFGYRQRTDVVPEQFTGRLSITVARLVNLHGKKIVRLVIIISAVAFIGLLKLDIATNHLYYFPESNPLRRSYQFVDEHFGGGLPLEILIKTSTDQMNQLITKLPDFESKLAALSGMGKVLSIYDALRFAAKWKPYGSGVYIDLERGLLPADLWQKIAHTNLGESFLHMQEQHTTIRVATRAHVAKSSLLTRLLRQIEGLCGTHFPEEEILITGLVPVLIRTQQYVIDSQIYSFSIAFVVILILFILIARSLKIGFLVTLANIVPILFILGFMGWLKIPLDTITIFIASIALGIIVDDTIHFIYRFKENIQRFETASQAIKQTFAFVGSPIISTSLVISGGFLVLVPSDFLPIRYFGLLSALIVMVALSANLLFLPVLLSKFLVKNKRGL